MNRREFARFAADSVVNRGNWEKIKKCMQKARLGRPLTIGFLGGSVTQGSLASSPETCYARLVFDWWRETFPHSAMIYVNAGVGGTTSQFGVARVRENLLSQNPDFIVVEFSVNDDSTEFFEETYEGLVRTILKDRNGPALLLLFNVRYDTGTSAEEIHLKVGKAYSLPCVSIKSSLYQAVLSGCVQASEITPDGLHPNDRGHRFVADSVIHCLEEIRRDSGTKENAAGGLPEPVTANQYENSRRLQAVNTKPAGIGFTEDLRPRKNVTDPFQKGWTAGRVGDSLVFETEGTGVAVQYRKSVAHPAPVAAAVLDGEEANAVRLDANFEETWGDCLYITTVGRNLPFGKHRLEIRVLEAAEPLAAEFYLASVIESYGTV